MTRRTMLVGAVLATGAVVCPGAGAASAAAATAATGPGFHVVAGNFVGGPADELFTYNPGTTPDYLTVARLSAGPGSALTATHTKFKVSGSYTPLVGDFDGDARDEILWYAPGSATDWIWNFTSSTTVTSTAVSVSGSYKPFVGDFSGDGVEDVFWYAPGSAGDSIWDFNNGGGHASIAQKVNGTYQPLAASFGKDNTDDIFWFGSGNAPDATWDFTKGGFNHTNPFTDVVFQDLNLIEFDRYGEGWRSEDYIGYVPGETDEPVVDFRAGDGCVYFESVDGTYGRVAVGDLFGTGQDDMVWVTPQGMPAVVWDFDVDAGGLHRYTYGLDDKANGLGAPTATMAAPALDTLALTKTEDIVRSCIFEP